MPSVHDPGLTCGTGHAKFVSLTGADGAVVSLVFSGAVQDTLTQLKLPGSSSWPIPFGHVNITLPGAPGDYILDAMNPAGFATEPANMGAALDFGFVNRTTWGPPNDLTGGTLTFHVVPEPATLVLLGLGGLAAIRRRMA